MTSNVTSFEVKVNFTDPETLLRPNMNVNAKFDAGKLNNALVIPTVAILRQKRGTGVRIITEKGTKFVPIKTGLTVNSKTEVLSGLQGNEKVLLSAPPGSRRNSNNNRPPGGGPPGGGPPPL